MGEREKRRVGEWRTTPHGMENEKDTPLAEHIVAFGRVLRRAGVPVGPDRMLDALRAIETVGVERREDVRQALFSIFVRKQAHVELFDQAFHLFWRAPSDLDELLQQALPDALQDAAQDGPNERVRRALQEPEEMPPAPPEQSGEEEEVEVVASYSAAEALRKKDFADFTAEEVEAAKAMMQRMRWPVPPQQTRRRSPRRKGRQPDLRATLRAALRHGGEPMHLHRRGRTEKPRPLVLLCDISGSMEAYARMLLHFMHAVTGEMQRVESFVFGTRLTRITRALGRRDVDEAVAATSDAAGDWGGGTRIGTALKDFNYRWLRRTLPSSGVALVISDGCDRGDIDLLEHEMARLHRACHRLLWLNPLLRYEGYEPLTRGMKAALPHIDEFLPVHNLRSLEQLGEALGEAMRPGGRHRNFGSLERAAGSSDE